MTAASATHPARFAGRAILITGAAGHLGAAMTEGFLRDGAVVIINGRSRGQLEALTALLDPDGERTRILCADAADAVAMKDGIEATAGELKEAGIAFGGLVNNAFAGTAEDSFASTTALYAHAAGTNLGAAAALIEICAPLLAQSAGAVVNIASMYGHVSPDPSLYPESVTVNPPHYGATKAGLLQLTRYYAVALAARGVRVNSVSPGPFPRPEMVRKEPEFAGRLASRVPIGRLGQPAEVYGALAFLLGTEASYVTGADIAVDGGWTAI